MTPAELRKRISNETFTASTAGYCDGFVQVNMLVLPSEYAAGFEAFAAANLAPIPLLETVRHGFHSTLLTDGANLLHELPSYDIFENGKRVARVSNIEKYYRDDLVFFFLSGAVLVLKRK